jgi:hypothetical protein
MDTSEVRMTNLFNQLGLDASEQGIADFIAKHPLPPEMYLSDAPFWNAAQRQLLDELLKADARWALVVDQLNEALHEPH